jgi:uncharacterized protein (UPF0332 family)
MQTDHDLAYSLAYNTFFQAGRALMFPKGYRPDGTHQQVPL